MKIGDLVMWKAKFTDGQDIGIILSFHPMDGDPFIWWAGDQDMSHCSKVHLGGRLILLGGSDENR